jgi:hypothetical protein
VFSKEFRRDMLQASDAGGGMREVAVSFAVSESWVRWIKQELRTRHKLAAKTTHRRRQVW